MNKFFSFRFNMTILDKKKQKQKNQKKTKKNPENLRNLCLLTSIV